MATCLEDDGLDDAMSLPPGWDSDSSGYTPDDEDDGYITQDESARESLWREIEAYPDFWSEAGTQTDDDELENHLLELVDIIAATTAVLGLAVLLRLVLAGP